MKFKDRKEAGLKLASLVADLDNPVVIALPRGGLPLAQEVANAFNWDLDVCVVRKLALPSNPEFALGAIAEEGVVYQSDNLGLKEVIKKEEAEIKRQKDLFKPSQEINLKDRDVLIIDDGLATGLTALVAGRAMKKKGAKKICGAFPVGTPQAKTFLKNDTYTDVFLFIEDPFLTMVSNYYSDFHQLTDEEATSYLK